MKTQKVTGVFIFDVCYGKDVVLNEKYYTRKIFPFRLYFTSSFMGFENAWKYYEVNFLGE